MRRSAQTPFLILSLLAAGCGGNPEPTPPIRSGTPPPLGSTLPHVMLLLPSNRTIDADMLRETIEQLATTGPTPFVYREGFVRDGQSYETQADVIREATRRKVQGMIVAAAVPDVVAPALEEARKQGVSVVTIGPEIPLQEDRFPRVELAAAQEPARQIVTRLAEQARTKTAAETTPLSAILLARFDEDWSLQNTAAALESELQAAGLSLAVTLRHGRSELEVRDQLRNALADHPEAALILFESDAGALATQSVAADTAPGHNLVFGGFIDRADPKKLPGASVLVRRNVDELARQAAKTALDLIAGRPAPERVQIYPSILELPDPDNS